MVAPVTSIPNPPVHAPVSWATYLYSSGYRPTMPNCPALDEPPDFVGNKTNAPVTTPINTAQGHKVK